MKKFSKILTVSLSLIFVVASVLTGFAIFGKKPDTNQPSNNSNNSEMLEPLDPTDPNVDYSDMIYFASESEDTGASELPTSCKGGCIYLASGSELVFENGTIENNEGMFGGAIYVSKGAKFIMTGGNISYNYALYGGAIYVEDGGICEIQGGTINYNKSENAPAIYVESGGKVTINNINVKIEHNDYVSFDEVIINFVVDGLLTKSIIQNVAVLNEANVPLSNDNCNGYFLDKEMTLAVDNGQTLSDVIIDDGTIMTANSTSASSIRKFTLYTKSATKTGLSYDLNPNTNKYQVRATDTSLAGDVVVPKTYLGVKVEGIVEEGFKDCLGVETVTLPATITNISKNAFYNCTGLQSLSFTNRMLEIGETAYYGCTGLTKVAFPASIVRVQDKAFHECANIERFDITNLDKYAEIDFVSITSNPTYHSNSMYLNGELVTSINLSDSVTHIGSYTFFKNFELNEINISSKIEDIGYRAFSGCIGVETFNVDPENPRYHSENNCLIETDTKTLINGYKTSTIPSDGSVTSLYEYSFCWISDLGDLFIPKHIQSIGMYSFYKSGNLTSVDIEDNSELTFIGEQSFIDATELASFDFGLNSKLETTEQSLFSNCTSLTEITLPNSLKTMGHYTFNGCTNLVTVNIPDSLEEIKPWTFRNCTNLVNVIVTENAKFTKIGSSAFELCSSLTSITVPDTITAIDDYAFNNCSILKEFNMSANAKLQTIGGNAFGNNYQLYSFTIPATVTSIASNAFNRSFRLVEIYDNRATQMVGGDYSTLTDVTVLRTGDSSVIYKDDNGLVYAKDSNNEYRFVDASNTDYTQIVIPSSVNGLKVTTLRAYALYYRDHITSIELSDGLKTIENYAFYGCKGLIQESDSIFDSTSSLYIPSTVTSISNFAFDSLRDKGYGFLLYSGTSATSYAKGIVAKFGYTREQYLYSMEHHLEEVYTEHSIKGGTLYRYGTNTETVVNIPDKITELAYALFDNNTYIETVNISDSVKIIGPYVFNGCKNLKNVNITDNSSLETIRDYAFSACYKLKSITLPNTLTNVATTIFNKCYRLVEVYDNRDTQMTPGSLGSTRGDERILRSGDASVIFSDGNGFEYFVNSSNECKVLDYVGTDSNITIPKTFNGYTISKIRDCAFYQNRTIENVTINNKITTIGTYAFYDVTTLKTVDFEDNSVFATFGWGAFESSENLTTFNLPESAKTVGSYAFSGCSNLKNINFDNVENVSESAFANCTSLDYVDLVKVKGINANAFKGCTGLKHMFIPSTCAYITESAFSGVSSDLLIYVGATDSSKYGTTWCSDFTVRYGYTWDIYQDALTYGYEDLYPEFKIRGTILDGYVGSAVSGIVIPDGITEVSDRAFYNAKINEITIPDSVRKVGDYAFVTSEWVTLKLSSTNHIQYVGDYAFQGANFDQSGVIYKTTDMDGYPIYVLEFAHIREIGSYAFSNTAFNQTGMDDRDYKLWLGSSLIINPNAFKGSSLTGLYFDALLGWNGIYGYLGESGNGNMSPWYCTASYGNSEEYQIVIYEREMKDPTIALQYILIQYPEYTWYV